MAFGVATLFSTSIAYTDQMLHGLSDALDKPRIDADTA